MPKKGPYREMVLWNWLFKYLNIEISRQHFVFLPAEETSIGMYRLSPRHWVLTTLWFSLRGMLSISSKWQMSAHLFSSSLWGILLSDSTLNTARMHQAFLGLRFPAQWLQTGSRQCWGDLWAHLHYFHLSGLTVLHFLMSKKIFFRYIFSLVIVVWSERVSQVPIILSWLEVM